MANKWVNLDILTYTINKLKALINNKADKTHNHTATDITQDNTHKFVDDIEKEKLSKIVTSGTGNAVLHDDGIYKELANANTIDDLVSSSKSTYSSNKINAELKKKADVADAHTHENKNVLDDISLERFGIWDEKTKKIITTGNGDKFLSDDGTYKIGSGGSGASDWSELNNKPFDTIDANTLSIDDSLKLSVKRISLTKAEYQVLVNNNTVDSTTLYIITDDNAGDSSSSGDGETSNHAHTNLSLLNTITEEKVTTWDSSKEIDDTISSPSTTYSSNKIDKLISNSGVGINDDAVLTDKTYSSSKIESRLTEVENTIAGGQNDQVKMWQKTYLNVDNGDTLYIGVSGDIKLDKAIVQAYKFVEGVSDTIEILKKFDNADAENFNYDSNSIEFNGNMKIKDTYLLNKTLNSDGYYESDIINKDLFLQLYRMEVGTWLD